jgi:predicted amidohydrolase
MTDASAFTVACAQLAPAIGTPADNLAVTSASVSLAAAAGARLLVLPELCTSGYMFADAKEAARLAEPIDGPAVSSWRTASARHGMVIVAGLCERRGGRELANSAVVIDRGELVGVYRKTHLWDREKLVFTPGREPPPVVTTSLGPIGVAICYDAWFPEVPRSLAMAGAELIAAPMNAPVLGPPLAPLPVEVVSSVAAAAHNRVFVAQSDRVGDERGVSWVGASAIIDPDGCLLAERIGQPALLTAQVDLGRARSKRLGDRNDALADRRPELYRDQSPTPRPLLTP